MSRVRFQRHSVLAVVVAVAVVLANASGAAARMHPGNEVYKQKTVLVTDGERGGATVNCPSGDRAITGGAYWHKPHANGDPTLDAGLDSSAPTANGLGWYATGFQHASRSLELTVTVLCLPNGSFGSYTVKTRTITVDPARSGNADLHCDDGQKIVMGGGVWQQPGKAPDASLNARITSSYPDAQGRGWSVAGRNEEDTLVLQLHVSAYCVATKVVGTNYHINDAGDDIDLGATDESYDHCPNDRRVLGGGVRWEYYHSPRELASDTGATLLGSSPTADGVSWYAAVRQDDPHELQLAYNAYSICIAM